MYYVITYKKNFIGLFTSYLNAKQYIDNNFKFDFIDDGKVYTSLDEYIEYYSHWHIKMIETVYKLKTCTNVININDIKKLDNFYIINNRLRSIVNSNYRIIFNNNIIEASNEEIVDLENNINRYLDFDINALIDQIEEEVNPTCVR